MRSFPTAAPESALRIVAKGSGEAASALPKILFAALILLSVLSRSPALLAGHGDSEWVYGDGDIGRQIGFSALFLLIALNAIMARGARGLLNVPIGLIVLLGWCWLSVAWAIDPEVAFRRAAFTTVVLLSLVYSVNVLEDRTILFIIGLCFALIVCLDWLVIPVLPQAIHQPGDPEASIVGDWRGIHVHKNAAGAFCALAAIFFVDMVVRSRWRLLGAALLALSIGFLIMTSSKTSNGFLYVACAVGLLICYGYRHPMSRLVAVVWGVGLSLVLVSIFEDRLSTLLAYFDDPTSFTGRVQIWDLLLDYVHDHPFLGSGFGSFWAIGNATPAHLQGKEWLMQVAEGHNGYLDLLAQTGLIGLGAAIVALIVHPMSILLSRELRMPRIRWYLAATLAFAWFHNLLESSLLDRANIVWMVMVVAYTMLIRQSEPHRA